MDRATNSTAPADRLFCALELSKNSWLLGIQFPDHQKASVYPIKGGDSEGLMAKLVAARDRWGEGEWQEAVDHTLLRGGLRRFLARALPEGAWHRLSRRRLGEHAGHSAQPSSED